MYFTNSNLYIFTAVLYNKWCPSNTPLEVYQYLDNEQTKAVPVDWELALHALMVLKRKMSNNSISRQSYSVIMMSQDKNKGIL